MDGRPRRMFKTAAAHMKHAPRLVRPRRFLRVAMQPTDTSLPRHTFDGRHVGCEALRRLVGARGKCAAPALQLRELLELRYALAVPARYARQCHEPVLCGACAGQSHCLSSEL